MDFTIKQYKQLLLTFHRVGYEFVTFKEYIGSTGASRLPGNGSGSNSNGKKSRNLDSCTKFDPNRRVVILRHDVDKRPANSLEVAWLEHAAGIRGSYYFRVVPGSYDLRVMKEIAALGHEIGYHYEDVDLESQKSKFKSKNNNGAALVDLAYESFRRNLESLRKDFDVTTACMHGSPRSRFDNRMIWEKYSYRDLGIIGEPYFDIDFKKCAYFSDTGRKWNGASVSVRDKVNSKYKFSFDSTLTLIDNIHKLPDRVMFTIHPQRWTDHALPWARELVWQNVKNIAKGLLVARSHSVSV